MKACRLIRFIHSQQTCLLWCFLCFQTTLLASESASASFTIAMPFAGADSPSNYTREPFALEELGVPSCRYQQVYSASEFSALNGRRAYISWIAFRSDSTFGRGFGAGLPSVEILM